MGGYTRLFWIGRTKSRSKHELQIDKESTPQSFDRRRWGEVGTEFLTKSNSGSDAFEISLRP